MESSPRYYRRRDQGYGPFPNQCHAAKDAEPRAALAPNGLTDEEKQRCFRVGKSLLRRKCRSDPPGRRHETRRQHPHCPFCDKPRVSLNSLTMGHPIGRARRMAVPGFSQYANRPLRDSASTRASKTNRAFKAPHALNAMSNAQPITTSLPPKVVFWPSPVGDAIIAARKIIAGLFPDGGLVRTAANTHGNSQSFGGTAPVPAGKRSDLFADNDYLAALTITHRNWRSLHPPDVGSASSARAVRT